MPGRTKSKPGAHCKKKQYKRSHATKCRSRDIDQIQVRPCGLLVESTNPHC